MVGEGVLVVGCVVVVVVVVLLVVVEVVLVVGCVVVVVVVVRLRDRSNSRAKALVVEVLSLIEEGEGGEGVRLGLAYCIEMEVLARR